MIITKHALFRMHQRGIDENIVASAILNPDETLHTFGKRVTVSIRVGSLVWIQYN